MRLAVVGSINIDMTVTAERIPLKGETLMGDNISYIPGGKGANQAVAMAKLGAEVEMFGCVGDDENGKKMIDNMKNHGIKTDNIKVLEGVPTGIAMITIGENDNTIIVVPGANGKVDKEYIDGIKEELKNYDMVVLQHEIPLETVHYTVEFCSENNIPVILNPAPAAEVPMEVVEKVTYLTPNEHEAVLIFGNELSSEELLKKYAGKLLITQGSKGVSTCLETGEILTVPARPAKVVDTTGAGDTLNGAFSVQIANGADIKTALTKHDILDFMVLNEKLAVIYVEDSFDEVKISKIPEICSWEKEEVMSSLIDITNQLSFGISASYASGVNYVNKNPYINASGKNVLIGIIDSGIDYLHPDFINNDNTTKIVSIWDQGSDKKNSPQGTIFGSEFTREDINKAIKDNDSTLTTDEIGTGTIAAGICAGRGKLNSEYLGVAVDSELVVVKLRQYEGKFKKGVIHIYVLHLLILVIGYS